MATFNYVTDIPAQNDDPSQDAPNMRINTNSTAQILAVNHFGFSVANGGKHQLAEFPAQVALPAGLVNGEGTLYAKTTSPGSQTQLFYSPDDTGDEYILTRTRTNQFATFGTNTNFSGTIFGGWSFLPGQTTGMILQYGKATTSGTGDPNCTVTLPVSYNSAPFSINLTVVDTSGSRFFIEVFDSSTTQFRATVRNENGNPVSGRSFYWQAIGV